MNTDGLVPVWNAQYAMEIREFRGHYGMPQEKVTELLSQYLWPEFDLKDTLNTLNWLKQYETRHHYAGWSREYSSRGVFTMLEFLQDEFVPSQIQWDDTTPPEPSIWNHIPCAVDGTHCPVKTVPHNVRDPETGELKHPWFSWKGRCTGVAYQAALNIHTQRIAHFWGPMPASIHDVTLWHMSGVLDHLAWEDDCIADCGYVGTFGLIAPCKYTQLSDDPITREQQKELGRLIASKRWLVESCFGRLKERWGCLQTPWRHHVTKHHNMMMTLAAFFNFDWSPLSKAEVFVGEGDTDDEDEF
eukprot:TRINITY_DN330_c0_g1_i1.p1 TRINITY_DN330_c0_g1~~TRINITY_DN330_c0_g1_i1.p1  ORF type:complete len:301 (+),score=24.53 TRINITY_DN330_c0_g1_i1:63-965(+)